MTPTLVRTLAALVATAATADAAAGDRLRLADVLAEAAAQNPEIRAAAARARAAAAVPARASAWDDPTFSWEAWNAPEPFKLDQADNNILRLSQKIPFPGKRTLAGTVAARDADVARHEAEAAGREVVAAVTRAYYDLWEAHRKLDVYTRERGLLERFARVAEQRYAVGEVAQSDVLQAQVELTRTINRVGTGTLAIEGAEAELNALLSRPAREPLGVPEDPPAPALDGTPAALTERALRERPELAAEEAAVAREEAAVRLARRGYYPDFEFSLARFFNTGQPNGVGAMASVSIPLAYKRKYDAAVDEASARLVSVEAERRRLRDRIRRDVEQAFLRARTALLQHDLFVTTHVPQAEQALRAAEAGYAAGRVDLLRLIDSARAIETIHLEHFEAAAEFERAYADLERAVGTAVPRGPGGRAEHGATGAAAPGRSEHETDD